MSVGEAWWGLDAGLKCKAMHRKVWDKVVEACFPQGPRSSITAWRSKERLEAVRSVKCSYFMVTNGCSGGGWLLSLDSPFTIFRLGDHLPRCTSIHFHTARAPFQPRVSNCVRRMLDATGEILHWTRSSFVCRIFFARKAYRNQTIDTAVRDVDGALQKNGTREGVGLKNAGRCRPHAPLLPLLRPGTLRDCLLFQPPVRVED